jgi:hypothetical protein
MKASFIGGGPWNGEERDIDVGRGWACVVSTRREVGDGSEDSPEKDVPILHVYARVERPSEENPWVFRYLGELVSSHLTGRDWDLEVLLQEMSGRSAPNPPEPPPESNS